MASSGGGGGGFLFSNKNWEGGGGYNFYLKFFGGGSVLKHYTFLKTTAPLWDVINDRSLNSIFVGPMLLFYKGYIVLVSHPDTNPARPLGINFSELWYYKAVRCSEGTLKLVVKSSCEGT